MVQMFVNTYKLWYIEPNEDIRKFNGVMQLETENKFSIDAEQLLLRGAQLSNTAWVIGLVVYTGHDTKELKNLEASRPKQSQLEQQLNRYFIYLFIFQTALNLTAGIIGGVWLDLHGFEHWYLSCEKWGHGCSGAYEGFLLYW
jgi:phospholipid-transporting ATPase